MINLLSIPLSGLAASSRQAETAASNIANLSTSGALEGENGRAPYRARDVVQTAQENGGVQAEVVTRNPGFVPAFDPGSPFANEEGLIGVPNVNLAEEVINLKLAELSYKANVSVLETARELSGELISLLDEEV